MILIVDDHDEIIDWMRSSIQEAGYYVDSAMDATVAFYKIQHLDYALAIIDIGLPDYPGDTLAKLVKTLPGDRGQTPLIAMSGADFTDTNGLFESVLTKPISLTDLHDAIVKRARPPIKDLHVTREQWRLQKATE